MSAPATTTTAAPAAPAAPVDPSTYQIEDEESFSTEPYHQAARRYSRYAAGSAALVASAMASCTTSWRCRPSRSLSTNGRI